jgi:hypothetical protein
LGCAEQSRCRSPIIAAYDKKEAIELTLARAVVAKLCCQAHFVAASRAGRTSKQLAALNRRELLGPILLKNSVRKLEHAPRKSTSQIAPGSR